MEKHSTTFQFLGVEYCCATTTWQGAGLQGKRRFAGMHLKRGCLSPASTF
jgi:hypothetical protein